MTLDKRRNVLNLLVVVLVLQFEGRWYLRRDGKNIETIPILTIC